MFCPKSSPSHLIGGPKGKALHLSIESSILGSLHSFNFFLQWANQTGPLQKKEKLDLWGTPNQLRWNTIRTAVLGRVFFARSISPGQKWWQTPLGREISCSQWEGPSMHSRCLPFKFGVGEGFFSFFPGSQCVSFKFPMGYIQVFNMFPKFPMCSPTCSP
jgi:hypothetical protein